MKNANRPNTGYSKIESSHVVVNVSADKFTSNLTAALAEPGISTLTIQGGIQVTLPQIQAIRAALKANKSVTSLRFVRNTVLSDALKELTKLVAENPMLTEVSIPSVFEQTSQPFKRLNLRLDANRQFKKEMNAIHGIITSAPEARVEALLETKILEEPIKSNEIDSLLEAYSKSLQTMKALSEEQKSYLSLAYEIDTVAFKNLQKDHEVRYRQLSILKSINTLRIKADVFEVANKPDEALAAKTCAVNMWAATTGFAKEKNPQRDVQDSYAATMRGEVATARNSTLSKHRGIYSILVSLIGAIEGLLSSISPVPGQRSALVRVSAANIHFWAAPKTKTVQMVDNIGQNLETFLAAPRA